MNEHKGIDRLRAAIKNQQDAGETCFMVSFPDAFELLDEVRQDVERPIDELTRLKLDLGMGDENPKHYEGDGIVSCARAMRSMCWGWEDYQTIPVPRECAYWAISALKYLWRFPLKGHPREDLMKAVDCANKALDAWGE